MTPPFFHISCKLHISYGRFRRYRICLRKRWKISQKFEKRKNRRQHEITVSLFQSYANILEALKKKKTFSSLKRRQHRDTKNSWNVAGLGNILTIEKHDLDENSHDRIFFKILTIQTLNLRIPFNRWRLFHIRFLPCNFDR